MTFCTVYLLVGGLTFVTTGCHSQLFTGDGVIHPHSVVYTSHMEGCTLGYGTYVDRRRVRIRRGTHTVRHHHVHRRYKQRVKYRHHHPRRHRVKNRGSRGGLVVVRGNRTIIRNNHYHNAKRKKKKRHRKRRRHIY